MRTIFELLFELYIEHPTLLNNPKIRDFYFKILYEKNPLQFMQALKIPYLWNMSPEEAYFAINVLDRIDELFILPK